MILRSFSKDYDESKFYCDFAQEAAAFSPSWSYPAPSI